MDQLLQEFQSGTGSCCDNVVSDVDVDVGVDVDVDVDDESLPILISQLRTNSCQSLITGGQTDLFLSHSSGA